MRVPGSNVTQFRAKGPSPAAIDPTYLVMAAAQMHAEGRLFAPAGEASGSQSTSPATDLAPGSTIAQVTSGRRRR